MRVLTPGHRVDFEHEPAIRGQIDLQPAMGLLVAPWYATFRPDGYTRHTPLDLFKNNPPERVPTRT